MGRKVRTTLALSIGSLIALSAVGCGSNATTTSSGSPGAESPSSASAGAWRIGVEAPLTGDQSTLGQGMLQGAQLAADQVNAGGGVLGRKVEIVQIDDAANPTTGVTAAKAAIAGVWPFESPKCQAAPAKSAASPQAAAMGTKSPG